MLHWKCYVVCCVGCSVAEICAGSNLFEASIYLLIFFQFLYKLQKAVLKCLTISVELSVSCLHFVFA